MDFSAFVIERKNATPGDPIGVVHSDIVTPFAPTSLAMCPGTATSPGPRVLADWFFAATAPVDPAHRHRPTRYRPAPQPCRSASGGYTSTAFVRSDDPGVTFSPPRPSSGLCAYPAGTPNPVDFFCGNG